MEMVQAQHVHVNRIALLPNAWWMPYSSTAVEAFRGFARHFATGSALRTARLLPQLYKRMREQMKKRD